MNQEFKERIRAMNKMYQLRVSDCPSMNGHILTSLRLLGFKRTLVDEVNEIDEIISACNTESEEISILVALADLLGDLVVYCHSEALKYGIPLEEVLSIIMDSNESKLGADGQPIYNEDGKFLKGPNHWKPEPKIRALLISRLDNKDSIDSEGGSSD